MNKVQAVKAALQREFCRGPNAWSDESLAKAAIKAANKWEDDAAEERAAKRPPPGSWHPQGQQFLSNGRERAS